MGPEIHAAIPCSAKFVGAMDPTGVADGSYMIYPVILGAIGVSLFPIKGAKELRIEHHMIGIQQLSHGGETQQFPVVLKSLWESV